MAASVVVTSGADVPSKLKLYSYSRSSCSFRVRIALNLKGLEYEYVPVNLLKREEFGAEFLKVNPINYVPALTDGDFVISDSFAILMYLEEKYPQHHPLLPSDLRKRAINYQAANIVSSSIQPYQNLYVMKFIEEKVGPCEPLAWVQYHIGRGFSVATPGNWVKLRQLGVAAAKCCLTPQKSCNTSSQSALEKVLADHAGKYATGDKVCLADVFLEPQIYAAVNWFNMDMSQYPILSKLHEAYSEIPAFRAAMPENQPDAPQPQA